MSFIGSILIIILVSGLGLHVIAVRDVPIGLTGKGVGWGLVGAVAEAEMIILLCSEEAVVDWLIFSVFGGCLLLACITDAILQQVYCFVWWIAMLAAGILLWRGTITGYASGTIFQTLSMFTIFTALQYMVFGRTYGRADCHAFVSCALMETALGLQFEVYFIHMIISYTFLTIAQILRRNVSKTGKLIRQVPFIPYINLSFWLMLGISL